jgi:hypothetical protein
MTAAELSKNIGKSVSVVAPFRVMPKPIRIKAVIRDARQTYGRVDYLIAVGDGQAWVNSDAVEIDNGETTK